MAKTPIAQLFRATIDAECDAFGTGVYAGTPPSYEAMERMHALDVAAKQIAESAGASYRSLNTQLLSHGAFEIEASSEQVVRSVVEGIEALIEKTDGARLLE